MELEVISPSAEIALPAENTLAGRIRQWIDNISTGLELKTIHRYRESLERFQLFVKTDAVTPELWTRYQRFMMGKKYSPSYLHKECAIINQFFKWCEVRKYVTMNPCKLGIRLPPVVVKTMPVFTHDEYEMMKNKASGKTVHYWLIVASYNTGASLCDVCLMKWKMIDMENMVINFVRQKTKRFQTPATIPFSPGDDIHKALTLLAEEIGESQPWPGAEYVCPELASRYLSTQTNPTELAQRLIKSCGIVGKSHKTFRWTFISNWANSGASTSLGCKVVGTKNPAIFTRYVNPDVDSMREALQDSMRKAQDRCGIRKASVLC